MRRALAVLLAALLAPAALAQDPGPAAPEEGTNPTRQVTFYPHIFTVGANAPMPGNTQYPWGEDDFSAGSVTACHDAFPAGAGQGFVLGTLSNCDEKPGLLYVYSTAGFVNADQDTWSYEDFHNERGQAKDVLLDTTQDITATLYMSADAHPWYPSTIVGQSILSLPGMPVWNWDPGLHPDWQVEATLYLMHLGEYQGQASDPPPVQEMMDSEGGIIVAQGLSEPQTVISLDSNINPNAGQGEVYEFQVNLGKPQVDRIPKEMDWVLRYRWWSTDGSQRYNIPMSWNVNSGEFYPNHFTLPVKNPFDVELVYPQFLHEKLLFHAILNSPWGSYDVDARSVSLEVTRDGQPVQLGNLQRVADFSVAHGGHYKPVNVTWVWDFQADGARPGEYTIKVTASNHQHSATSTLDAAFRLRADGTGEVLRVGRQGQQTASTAQLDAIGAGP